MLEALGVDYRCGPGRVAREIDRYGVGFLFAPRYHRATRHAAEPRREIGVRSIFNLVGPLTNPAGVKRQLLGVYDREWTGPLARVLARLGSTHCMVVHGEDGLDEITLGGRTHVSEIRGHELRTYEIDPRQLGFEIGSLDRVRGGTPEENARICLEVLGGGTGAPREIVLLNAGAVIYVGGRAASLEEGVRKARESIDSGRAMAKLEALQREKETNVA
jgi:anthranilate phosphoribosyltransferase